MTTFYSNLMKLCFIVGKCVLGYFLSSHNGCDTLATLPSSKGL